MVKDKSKPPSVSVIYNANQKKSLLNQLRNTFNNNQYMGGLEDVSAGSDSTIRVKEKVEFSISDDGVDFKKANSVRQSFANLSPTIKKNRET